MGANRTASFAQICRLAYVRSLILFDLIVEAYLGLLGPRGLLNLMSYCGTYASSFTSLAHFP